MSSFFDQATAAYNDPSEIVNETFRVYQRYLMEVQARALVADRDSVGVILSVFAALDRKREAWLVAQSAPARTAAEWSEQHLNGQLLLEGIHDLGHTLGRSRIRLRGGRHASDNPRREW